MDIQISADTVSYDENANCSNVASDVYKVQYTGSAAPTCEAEKKADGKCDVGYVLVGECCSKECKPGYERNKKGKCECNPNAQDPNNPAQKQCCGIKLNTVVPFIGNCIEMRASNQTYDPANPNKTIVNQINAFPILMGGLTKIMVTVILIMSFMMVIIGGAMMTFGDTKVGGDS